MDNFKRMYDMNASDDVALIEAFSSGNPANYSELEILTILKRRSSFLREAAKGMDEVAARMESQGMSSLAPFRKSIWMV